VLISKYENLRKEMAAGKEKLDNCLTLAQRLKSPDGDLEKNRDLCKDDWDELTKAVEVRGRKLEAAGEIHKFNRDVAEALLRIQEKGSSLGNETGKDIKSIQRLLRQQDVFDNDLVALQSQLEALAEDSASLQNKYPGPNAHHITEQLSVIEQSWTDLKAKAKAHRQLLQASFDFQTFLLTCQVSYYSPIWP
jgi:spectrin beta